MGNPTAAISLKLYEFDANQTKALMAIEDDLSIMERWLADIESLFREGLTGVHFESKQWAAVHTDQDNLIGAEIKAGTFQALEGKRTKTVKEKGKNSDKKTSTVEEKPKDTGIDEIIGIIETIDADKDVNIDNFDFGKYLKKHKGDPPEEMKNHHAHHILFKRGNGQAQQELV